MGNFFAELRRRHVYRIGAAYVVVAWLLLQVVNNVAPVLDLPPWIARAILLMLAVGFPIALLLAWIVEPAPQPGGRKGGRKAAQPASDGRVDWVLAGALGIVIAIFVYQQLAPSRFVADGQPGIEAARTAAESSTSAISLAVLPFENLSGDASQEFFSDGMTEEITAALAKVPDLRVVARTSVYQFKAQDRDIRSIGEQLHATHFIEGSVRMAGTRVRITAQLIKAGDGTHLWSENYDREMTDIFAVQEDIARAITASLRVPLGLNPGENLINNRSIDAESHQQYLRARALILARGQSNLAEAATLLEQVVAGNPEYAPAWAVLAQAYSLTPIFWLAPNGSSTEASRRVVDDLLQKASAAAQRAVRLDPNSAAGYQTLGYLQYVRGKLLVADEFRIRALALEPNDPGSLQGMSLLLAEVGRLKEANAMKQQLQALDPFVPVLNLTTGLWLWVEGQNDAAIAILKALPPGPAANGLVWLPMIYASLGRYAEAADLLENLPGAFSKDAARLLRTAPAKAATPENLPQLGVLDWVYLYVGAPERALDRYERDVQNGFAGGINLPLVWHASFAPVRKTERFKAYVRARGLVEYWREKGWPQWCHPTAGDDFVCE